MGKIKKGPKKNLSDFRKKPEQKKPLNPFEVHVNRQKFQVLGRKMKSDRGLPGISRAKAITKRKATLLQEYKVKDKNNKFMDRRIGEKNSAMTAEDRVSARFTAERIRAHNKKVMFNLADEEVLTHRGQTLNEIEKFDDPRSEDEDEDDGPFKSKGNLDSDFVGDAHFGGGLLSHSAEGGLKSRKDLIDQLIADSKKRKAEQQKQREQTLDLTDKLDNEWKELLPVMTSAPKAADTEKPKPDSYDIVMRELKFEARGKPSDRLKSVDEVAREEKEKLEALEAERLRRMQGDLPSTSSAPPKHRSADDLDDGFEVDDVVEEDEDGALSMGKDSKKSDNSSGEEEDDGEDDEESDQSDDSVDEEGHVNGDFKGDRTVDQEGSENEEQSESSSDEDDMEDLKYDSSEDESSSLKNPDSSGNVKEKQSTSQVCEASTKAEKIREELRRRKELMEAARKELPYTFEIPDTFEELQIALAGREPEYQGVIVERMIKCTHPSLGAGNKEKLANLFALLMQHLHDAAVSEESNVWAILDRFAPHLFDITQWCHNDVARCLRDVVQEKQQEFRKCHKEFPGVETLVFFKVISLLFPTSDFRHPVVTPALVFMCQMLSSSRINTRQDVARGLLLVSYILEYTALSKRFSPEAVNFLRNMMYSASSFSENQKTILMRNLPAVRSVPPFKLRTPQCSLLRPQNTTARISLDNDHLSASDLTSDGDVDDQFRMTTLLVSMKMTSALVSQLVSLAACRHLFSPFYPLVESLLNETWLPGVIKNEAESLLKLLQSVKSSKLKYLVPAQKRPKPLKLYEPLFEQVYADGKQRRPENRERQETEKLLHRVKREKKGAIREIRKDRDFLAKIKLKQQLKSDAERKAKVKEIYGEGAMQQGEMRKFERQKKR